MASQVNGEAINQAKGQESTAQCEFPTSDFRHFQQLIENLKCVAVAENFQYVVDHLAEVDNLRQEVKVNRREIERLNSEVQTNKSNSKLAYQDVLDAQVESARKKEEEKNDVLKQLDKVRKDLKTQQESNAEVNKSKSQLEAANVTLRNERQSLTESGLQAQARIKELENQSIAQAQIISQLQETSRQQEIQLDLATKNSDALEEQKEFYRKRYDGSDRSLQRLKELSYPLSPDRRDDASSSMQRIWHSCLDVVRKYFKEDLKLPVHDEDLRTWLPFKQSPQVDYSTPLPETNSREAKQMRSAVVLAILAKSLAEHIFTPTYLIQNDKELRSVLFGMPYGQKKDFLRGLLLNLFEDDQQGVKTKKISTVVQEVVHPVYGLLGLHAAQKFSSDLLHIIQRAADVWWEIQRQRSHFEADREHQVEGWEWHSLHFVNDDNDQMQLQNVRSSAFNSDEALLVLFPRVYTIDEEKDTSIFPGVVLQRSQTTAAEKELRQMTGSSPIEGRPRLPSRSARERRMSFPPTVSGPTVTSNRNGSFLGRRD